MAVNQDLTHELSISEIETATRFHGGLAALAPGGAPPGRETALTARTGAPPACRRSHPHTRKTPGM
jgi:hypothetical protein